MIGFKKTEVVASDSNPQQNQTAAEKRLKNFEVTDSDREDYHNLVDILFVIDTTGSMSWCFDEAKNTVVSISEMFNKQEFDIKYALCEYKDHPPQDRTFVYKHSDLQNSSSMVGTLNSMSASGGGDGPEAVMDGLFQGLALTKWRKDQDGTASKRFLFHICDAPPHGEIYGGSSSDKDWQKNGCPCKITAEKIKQQLDEKNVTYNLIECGGIGNMETVFKKVFGTRFEETIHISQQQIQQQSYAPMPTYHAPTSSLFGYSSSTPPPMPSYAPSASLFGDSKASMPMSMPIPEVQSLSFGSSLPPMQPQQQQQNLYCQQVQQNLMRNLY